MIVDIDKMHTKNVNFKNRVCAYFDNLIKPKKKKKIETKNILIDKENYKDLVI